MVERRSIERGPLAGGGVVVRSGLEAADRVVVNGLLNARAGEKVAPQTAPATEPTPAPKG